MSHYPELDDFWLKLSAESERYEDMMDAVVDGDESFSTQDLCALVDILIIQITESQCSGWDWSRQRRGILAVASVLQTRLGTPSTVVLLNELDWNLYTDIFREV